MTKVKYQVLLTGDQLQLVADILWSMAFSDDNEQTRAFKLRVWDKIVNSTVYHKV